MHPQTPQDRRAFESPDFEERAARTPASRRQSPTRNAGWIMLASFALLVTIVALILLL